jgi:hypothetical protein
MSTPKDHWVKCLARALIRMRRNANVPEEDKYVLSLVGMDLLRGHDARELIGIKRKRGPRETYAAARSEIAFHYYRLQLGEPFLLAKQAGDVVSAQWGIPSLRIKKIAGARRIEARRAAEMDTDGKRLKHCEFVASIFSGNISRTPISSK